MRQNGRAAKTPYALLGMLSIAPMSGYDIRKNIEETIAHFWNESYGQIYPALKRLHAEGLIARRNGATQAARDRQVYAITAKGREALQSWLAESPSYEPARFELLLKVFFARNASPDHNLRHITEYRERTVRELAEYERIERTIKQSSGIHPDAPFWLMTLSYGRRKAQASLEWCDETLKGLRRMQHSRARQEATSAM
jgi:PadR family transcriptional regulator AphA